MKRISLIIMTVFLMIIGGIFGFHTLAGIATFIVIAIIGLLMIVAFWQIFRYLILGAVAFVALFLGFMLIINLLMQM